MSPVRSMTPSSRPVSGSMTGAAAQVQRCTGSVKCSAAKTCTACSAASAVPTALVPAPDSLHSAPSTKFMSSAARLRSWASPRMLQQHAVGVADDEQVVGLDRRLGHALVDQRRGGRAADGRPTRARAPAARAPTARPGGRSGRRRRRASAATSRRSARGSPACRRPRRVLRRRSVDEVLPRVAQLPGALGRDRGRVDRYPGTPRHPRSLLAAKCRRWRQAVPPLGAGLPPLQHCGKTADFLARGVKPH